MPITHQRSVRDIRLDVAHSYHHAQDDTYRTPVEVLEQRYAQIVEKLKENKKSYLKLEKRRGDKSETKYVVLTDIVRRKINKFLPRIKELSNKENGFVVGDFAALLKVHRVAAHKYLNILLASGLLVSDEKPWAARYSWNDKSPKSCL